VSRQEEIRPRFERWYQWAEIIAGDLHYIRRHMPGDLHGKIIVTNTTTTADLVRLSRPWRALRDDDNAPVRRPYIWHEPPGSRR
jgi:hypothetical protein